MSERADVRAFMSAFVLSIVVAGVVPFGLVAVRFAAIGEFDVLENDASLAAQRIHGPLDLPEPRYKFRMATIRRPRVLLLGSSNVLSFRASIFTACRADQCFYNAGLAMPTTRAGLDLVRGLIAAGAAPEVLLLSLDVWELNPRYEENTHQPTRPTSTLEDEIRLILGVTRAFAPRILTDPELRDLMLGLRAGPPGHRGARAMLRLEGDREDGSYAQGPANEERIAHQTPAQRSADVLGRIARDCCRFQRFTEVDRRSIEELEELFTAASRAGVKVVAFNVPLSDEVMDAIDGDPAERAAVARVEEALRDVTARHDVPFVWTARPSEAGCSRPEMMDGFHPGEVCSARILRRLLGQDRIAATLRPFVDPAALEAKVAAASSDLHLDRE